MADGIPALLRREEVERRRDERHYLVERAGARGPEECFQFGERLFDGIEVGTVRRQKTDRRGSSPRRSGHRRQLVR